MQTDVRQVRVHATLRAETAGFRRCRLRSASASGAASSAPTRAAIDPAVTKGRSAARVTTISAVGRAEAKAATGPPPVGDSWVWTTVGARSSRCGPTTVTRENPSTAARAVSSIDRPPTTSVGLSTPPIRVARPPATMTASDPDADSDGVDMHSCCPTPSDDVRTPSESVTGTAHVDPTPGDGCALECESGQLTMGEVCGRCAGRGTPGARADRNCRSA